MSGGKLFEQTLPITRNWSNDLFLYHKQVASKIYSTFTYHYLQDKQPEGARKNLSLFYAQLTLKRRRVSF